MNEVIKNGKVILINGIAGIDPGVGNSPVNKVKVISLAGINRDGKVVKHPEPMQVDDPSRIIVFLKVGVTSVHNIYLDI